MNIKRGSVLVLAAVVSVVFAGVLWADDEADKPIPQEKQDKLLERFGDQGIDADEDGVLTREEVKAFMAAKKGQGNKHRRGARGGRGPGMGGEHPGMGGDHPGMGGVGPGGGQGMKGQGKGPGGRMAGLLKQLEQLDPNNIPTDIDPRRLQRIDADGNGELSAEEWTAFVAEVRPKIIERLLTMAPESDTDKNGELSDAELAAFQAAAVAKFRAHFLIENPAADTDGDGQLSDEEFEAAQQQKKAEKLARMLEQHPEADLDGDGTLSEDEVKSFMQDRREQRPARMGEKREGRKGHKGRKGEGKERRQRVGAGTIQDGEGPKE